MKIFNNILCGICWGIISFVLVFFAIPKSGIADFIWISLCVILPVLLAVFMFRKIFFSPPVYIFVGFVTQIMGLVLCRDVVAHIWSIRLSGLGRFEYMGLFIYPVVTTVLSYIVLKIINKKAVR